MIAPNTCELLTCANTLRQEAGLTSVQVGLVLELSKNLYIYIYISQSTHAAIHVFQERLKVASEDVRGYAQPNRSRPAPPLRVKGVKHLGSLKRDFSLAK